MKATSYFLSAVTCLFVLNSAESANAKQICLLYCPSVDICEMKFSEDGRCSCECKTVELEKNTIENSAIADSYETEVVALTKRPDGNVSFSSITGEFSEAMNAGRPEVPATTTVQEPMVEGGTSPSLADRVREAWDRWDADGRRPAEVLNERIKEWLGKD